ncbi:HNH endonuclease signature motif containing protein [Peribacillus butanolivorans]|uniref:HNH endonuclease signature motif containing protein n=1 Tax=Peribacillus butanolivorans TaxID=421767 RepID=UPI00366868D9
MSISEEVAAEVLSKSARHCCICRNYLPLAIQVHHIKEKHEGGSDDFDNLIPVCIQCHANIHTFSKMTRNFTEKELKKSRDTVYEMVSMGKLPGTKPMTTVEIESLSSILAETLRNNKKEDTLSNDAVEILSMMLCEDAPAVIRIHDGDSSYSYIEIGNQSIIRKSEQGVQYPSFIIELLSKGLIETKGNILEITDAGKSLISNLVQTTATYTQKKIKCLECGLHYIICTWEKDKHDSSTVHCPECGQKNGNFLVWTQQKLGFIYQEVPGNAMLYDYMGSRQKQEK